MDAVIAALTEQHAELASLLTGLDELDWQRPSACEGWTVADVVLHLAQADETAIGSGRGRFAEAVDQHVWALEPGGSVDDVADLMVTRERGRPGSVVYDRWQSGATTLRETLAACDPHQRLEWVAGELSARTLATTRLAETWIHTGDIAAGLGLQVAPTDRLWHIARLAWRTLPCAFTRAGSELTRPVAFKLRAPSGAAWDFVPDSPAATVIQGDATELCMVAARRVKPQDTALQGDGPDAAAVLDLVRTWA